MSDLAGMKLWHGGDNPPADWDGGPTLFRDGTLAEYFASGWDWQHRPSDPPEVRAVEIIAYTPKFAPAPSCAPGEVERLRKALEPFARLGGPIKGEAGRISYVDAIGGNDAGEELLLSTNVGNGTWTEVLSADDFRAAFAALSPQGLDAKGLRALLQSLADAPHASYPGQLVKHVYASDCPTCIASHLLRNWPHATPSQRLDAATVERLTRIRTSMALLQQNSEGCALNHYGNDAETHGLPGWLADTKRDLEALTDILATEPHRHGRKA